jgi:hypothetical protein
MALSNPILVAGANNFNSVGPPTTLTAIDSGVTANVGDLVIVLTGGNRSSTTSIVDTGLNTWTADSNTATGANSQFAIHHTVVTTQIVSTNIFTATWSVGSPNRFLYVYVVTGASASPFDKTARASNVGALAWTSGNTATLAQAAELIIGGSTNNTNAAITSTPTNSNIELVDVETSDQCAFTVAYKIVASTTGTAATGTWSAGTTTVITAATATFMEAAGGSTTVKALAAMGVG